MLVLINLMLEQKDCIKIKAEGKIIFSLYLLQNKNNILLIKKVAILQEFRYLFQETYKRKIRIIYITIKCKVIIFKILSRQPFNFIHINVQHGTYLHSENNIHIKDKRQKQSTQTSSTDAQPLLPIWPL